MIRRDAEKGVPDNVAREAEALSRIGHANVLALRDVYIEGSYLCLATELAATSVHDVIASVSSFVPLSVAKASISPQATQDVPGNQHRHIKNSVLLQGIAQQLLRGLAAVHKARILHRDLKPSNVLIAPG